MLSQEAARERLKGYRKAAWTRDAKARVDQLPEPDARATRALVFAKRGGRDWEAQRQAMIDAARHLDAMSVKARTAAFAALFPKLAVEMELCWQRMKTEPYTEGYYGTASTPFRLPASSGPSLLQRGNWLQSLTENLKLIDEDAVWLAQWAPYLGYYHVADCLGGLLASAIDAGGDTADAVYRILVESAKGEHEVGMMGRHVTRALLSCSREDAWAFMEKFLLAAQRQEGLRQNILETVDCAHPQAFRRMLRLILDENLVRFASVIRAADVWLGLRWDSASTPIIKHSLEQALHLLDNPDAQTRALEGKDPQQAYFAVWAQGVSDASVAVQSAIGLLKHDRAEMRFTGAWLLKTLQLPEGEAALAGVLDDPSLEVVNLAVDHGMSAGMRAQTDVDVFAKLSLLIDRVPRKPKPLKAMLFPWLGFKFQQSEVADLMGAYATPARFDELVAYVPLMSPQGRQGIVHDLNGKKALPESARALLLKLCGDASSYVREEAIRALGKVKLKPDEAPQLEALLKRKAGDLRRGVFKILQKQPPKAALGSVDRLLGANHQLQRAAGVELLALLAESDPKLAASCRSRARRYADEQGELSESDRALLNPLLGIVEHKPTCDNALGLMDPGKLTPARPMKDRKAKALTKAAIRSIQSLDAWVHAHRERPVKVVEYDGEKQGLLGNQEYGLRANNIPEEERDTRFPEAELWLTWYDKRPKHCRDKDGFELLRAKGLMQSMDWRGRIEGEGLIKQVTGIAVGDLKLNYRRIVSDVIDWLTARYQNNASVDFLLDTAESGLAALPKQKFPARWLRGGSYCSAWLHRAQVAYDEAWTPEQRRRLFAMLIWYDKPVDAKGRPVLDPEKVAAENKGKQPWQQVQARSRPAPLWFARAYQVGIYNDDDVYDQLLGPREGSFDLLRDLSSRKPSQALQAAPALRALMEKARDRVLEVELARGDAPTAATQPALALRYIPGAETLAQLLKAMGKLGFARGYAYSYGETGQDKKSVFSDMIRVSGPADSDTPASLMAAMNAAGVTEQKLIEVGMFAPQWAGLIEQGLGWDGYEDAVWWVHAHTKDDQWSVDAEVREQWTAAVAERTPLESQELIDGAVDVNWFLGTYDRLKKAKWRLVDASAKFASSSGGHKRAQLFADAMLGSVTKTELLKRIKDKRNKDAVRALGLLPLQRGKSREKDLLSRYEVMQEFVRTSRQFGQMRQASEKRASEIGRANLARTAGFPDPLRLEWAMEAKAIEDLRAGSLTVTTGQTEVTLSITEIGEPSISVCKAGKALKSVPASAKKDRAVKELTQRKTALKRQAARMRKSLEQMMCRGEVFQAGELADLCQHPLMRPMLERVIFIGEGIIGFPSKAGRVLVDHKGDTEPIKKNEKLRIAHPLDLFERGDWSNWQHDVYSAERVQPFKQVYRELYVLTKGERADKTFSKRYAGQQVNPRQALALLGGRGWVTLPEEGIRRTFHDAKLSAWIEFQEGFYTPAEIDGLTLENVRFSRSGGWKPIGLETVPPLIFSEVMRDIDLLVSVAHRGGVDPEASASTVQMRSDLLRETLAALSIDNVRIENNHALIKGDYASYSVHLGSAVTHLMPGGSIFMVPVHSQHRGRLFLPFADDDPKTAEVISKTLMLARDKQIKDANLLDQIRLGMK